MKEGTYFRKETYFRQNECQSDYTGDNGRYLFDRGNRYDSWKPEDSKDANRVKLFYK